MGIKEMHILFRQFAQQMGMQNTRGILAEQIDMLINTSISDTLNQTIITHIGLTNDRAITDNSKLGQINTLRTLYVSDGSIEINTSESSSDLSEADILEREAHGKFVISNFIGDTNDYKVKGLFLVGLSVIYKNTITEKLTDWFKVRIEDSSFVADSFRDYNLKPTVKAPIGVINGEDLIIYFGRNYPKGNGELKNTSLTPVRLWADYIKHPNVVAYNSWKTDGGADVDCDLPVNTHVDIVKHAVDLYLTSIRGSLYSAQQQAKAQEQRNQNRQNNNE